MCTPITLSLSAAAWSLYILTAGIPVAVHCVCVSAGRHQINTPQTRSVKPLATLHFIGAGPLSCHRYLMGYPTCESEATTEPDRATVPRLAGGGSGSLKRPTLSQSDETAPIGHPATRSLDRTGITLSYGVHAQKSSSLPFAQGDIFRSPLRNTWDLYSLASPRALFSSSPSPPAGYNYTDQPHRHAYLGYRLLDEYGLQMTSPLVRATTGSSSGYPHLQQEAGSGGDKALTQAKLTDLRRDIQLLDAAIRQKESARKDLVDRLFDQMGAEDTQPSTSSSTAAGAKSVFDENMEALSKQCKLLYSRLEDTRYVVSQLEQHDLPFDVDPKVYVKELLLRRRGSGTASQAQPAPASKRYPLESSPTQLRLIDRPYQPQATSLSHSNLSHIRSSRTLPMPPPSRAETGLIVARKTKTMPPGGFPDGGAQLPTITTTAVVVPPLARKNSDPSYFVTPSSEEGRAMSVARLQPSAYKSSSLGGEGERKRRMAEQPPSEDPLLTQNHTSPDLLLLTHHRHQREENGERRADSVDLLQLPVSKEALLLRSSGTKADQLSSNVLSSILHGMENFGRRLPWSSKQRSVSDEDLNPGPHDKSPVDRLLKPLRFPTLTSMKKLRQVKRKHSVSSYEPPQTQQSALSSTALADTNPRLPNSDPTSQQMTRRVASYSISNSSTNGILPPGLSAPPGDEGACSWLAGDDPTAAVAGSNSGGDQVLSRIFETLADASAATQTQHRTGGGVGSFGSSLSVVGAPTNSLPSNGRSMEAQPQQHQALVISSPLASAATVGQAFALYHRHQEVKLAAMSRHNADYFRLLHEELITLKSQNTELHNSLNNVTAQLESIRRDVTTSEELHRQHLNNATAHIDQLDANVERSKQDLHSELFEFDTKITSKVESLEYQLTTKTRDLDDNITSLSNKVNILEKQTEGHSLTTSQGSELSRKVLHCLIDLVLLVFAVLTMLLRVLIRSLNLGAVITENRFLAVLVTGLFYFCLTLVCLSGPLLIWFQLSPTGPVVPSQLIHDLGAGDLDGVANQLTESGSGNTTMTTGSLWRDAFISFLSFLHRFIAR